MIFQKDFTLLSDYPKAETIQRLKKITGEKKLFSNWGTSPHIFEGDIWEDSFKINRIIKGRNSFIPVIKGAFQTKGDKTSIALTFRLHTFVKWFMVFLFVFSLSVGSFTSFMLNDESMEWYQKLLYSPLMFFVLPIIGLVSFNLECQKAIKLMEETLNK